MAASHSRRCNHTSAPRVSTAPSLVPRVLAPLRGRLPPPPMVDIAQARGCDSFSAGRLPTTCGLRLIRGDILTTAWTVTRILTYSNGKSALTRGSWTPMVSGLFAASPFPGLIHLAAGSMAGSLKPRAKDLRRGASSGRGSSCDGIHWSCRLTSAWTLSGRGRRFALRLARPAVSA